VSTAPLWIVLLLGLLAATATGIAVQLGLHCWQAARDVDRDAGSQARYRALLERIERLERPAKQEAEPLPPGVAARIYEMGREAGRTELEMAAAEFGIQVRRGSPLPSGS